MEEATLKKPTIGLLKVAPLDAAEVLGYGKSGRSFYPYCLLPTIRDLEERTIFDPGTCEDKFRAQVSWMYGQKAEVVSYDEPNGQETLRECPARVLRRCFADVGDFVMFYLGAKEGKPVIHAERIGDSLVFSPPSWF